MAALALVLLAACASIDYRSMSAAEIYNVGQDYFDRGKWNKAKETFEKLKEIHPFSLKVTPAELRIAECLYEKKDYAEAIVALEEFLIRHPTYKDVPEAIYYLGLSNYAQKLSIDRDQSFTVEANRHFRRLTTQFPDTEWAEKARPMLIETRERLAKRERYVGKFYWKQREYYSALGRYLTLIDDYPDTSLYEEALYMAARCELKLNELADARRHVGSLLTRFPDGKYADDTRDLLEKIDERQAEE